MRGGGKRTGEGGGEGGRRKCRKGKIHMHPSKPAPHLPQSLRHKKAQACLPPFNPPSSSLPPRHEAQRTMPPFRLSHRRTLHGLRRSSGGANRCEQV